MSREWLKRHCKKICKWLKDVPTSATYLEHKYVLDLLEQTERIEGDMEEISRDIQEIKEVMNCDADAETKCKMISNILTAKPHYFKEPRK